MNIALLLACVFACCLVAHAQPPVVGGMLFPQDSETREFKLLSDYFWNFQTDNYVNQGIEEGWFNGPLPGPTIPMPVPSSYNDITQNNTLKYYLGWVWYQRTFYAPPQWQGSRVMLRVESAHYYSVVWVNGQNIVEHNGGHLPFEGDVSNLLNWGELNTVTIAVNNTLNDTTLPPGIMDWYGDAWHPAGYHTLTTYFDFFNYAGIHRHVKLYRTPTTWIDDFNLTFAVPKPNLANINYAVSVQGDTSNTVTTVSLIDAGGNVVAQANGTEGILDVLNPNLWWPTPGNPYLYTFQVKVFSGATLIDVYRKNVGIRTVSVTNGQFLINGLPFYFYGVDKHEDSWIRGKGLDYALIAKDFNLLNWLSANSFRSSHYPYADEILDFADANGIVVINEAPAVGLNQEQFFNDETLAHHKQVLQEMIRRDKNRPSTVMWSVANEPMSSANASVPYFQTLYEFTHAIDPQDRPVTFVSDWDFYDDLCAQFFDVNCINRYYAWYSDPGKLQLINFQMNYDITSWYNTFKKPIIISEYGADTTHGDHGDPSTMFTQEFQVDFLEEYHASFDQFRQQGIQIGELIWNFADFETDQSDTRVASQNKKGVFTRERQPKSAAFTLQARYQSLAQEYMKNTLSQHPSKGGKSS